MLVKSEVTRQDSLLFNILHLSLIDHELELFGGELRNQSVSSFKKNVKKFEVLKI